MWLCCGQIGEEFFLQLITPLDKVVILGYQLQMFFK
jgi:hypothetical protein